MSLAPSTPVRVIERDGYALTNYRALCRRGVLWIGQTCNLRCHFCYFLDKIKDKNHPEHDFLPIDKLKAMCKTLVDVYGNNSVDIQGGEPTLYRHLPELLRYCNEIGLKPTLITNGQVLANIDRVRQLKDAGVYDLLISMHGLGKRYDKIVVVDGAAAKLQKAINNVAEVGIPFRLNCVLATDALPDLLAVAELAVAKGARTVNYIAFNPFVDQSCGGKRSAENVPRYSDVVSYLLPAIDLLEANGIECNVRYLPFCLFPEKYRKHLQNFQQITYDLHEWEAAGEAWSSQGAQRESKAVMSEPIDFFRYIEHLRLRGCGEDLAQLPSDQRWGPSVTATLDALEERVRAFGPQRVALFGSDTVGESIRAAAEFRPALRNHAQFAAYISSEAFRTADTLHGLPWQTPEWLAARPVDVVLNTSESSRGAITSALASKSLLDQTIEVFGTRGKAPRAAAADSDSPLLRFDSRESYQYLPYLPELAPIEGAGVVDHAYKEFRVLMPKVIHPYAKGPACGDCSARSICDGFHKDYGDIFGFDEASALSGALATNPNHYAQHQLKVVEAQEFDWALPAEHPLAVKARLAQVVDGSVVPFLAAAAAAAEAVVPPEAVA